MNISDEIGVERLAVELSVRTKVVVVIETSICAALCILGLLLNCSLVFALYRNVKLREVANVFVFELALCDLLASTTVFPFMISSSVHGGWTGGVFWCQLQAYWASVLACVSYQTIALAAISRYVRVLHPRSYNSLFRFRYTVYALLTAWLFACGAPLTDILSGHNYTFHPGKGICVDSFYDSGEKQWLFRMGFFIFLPFFIELFCYFMIYLAVRRHRRRLGVYLRHDFGELGIIETPKNVQKGNSTKTEELAMEKIDNITHNLQSFVENPPNQQETNKIHSQITITNPWKLSMEEIKSTRTYFTITACFFLCRIPMVVASVLDIVHEGLALPRQVYLLATYLVGISSTLNPVIFYTMNSVFRTECIKVAKYLRESVAC